jgi:hypothetical protein
MPMALSHIAVAAWLMAKGFGDFRQRAGGEPPRARLATTQPGQ